MKFQFGSVSVDLSWTMATEKPKFELTITKDVQPGITFAVNVSYWAGSENPLIIKGELKTDNPQYK